MCQSITNNRKNRTKSETNSHINKHPDTSIFNRSDAIIKTDCKKINSTQDIEEE